MMRGKRKTLRSRARMAVSLAGALSFMALGALPAYADTVYSHEWALSKLQADTIRADKYHGDGVMAAVIDTGVDPNQADLQGSLVSGVNLVTGVQSTDTSDTSSAYHGTDMAAIIAGHAHGTPPDGMIGLATHAKIMPIKVGETPSLYAIESGIRYAADHGAKVISISVGLDGACPQSTADAVGYALSKGSVIVVATGNTAAGTGATNAPDCPAAVPGVMDVSAISQSGTMDPYSHYGSDVTVAAPGVNVEVPSQGGTYKTISGSSPAAPWVSAEAALLIGKHPDWTAGQVIRAIIDNTDPGSGQRVDDHVGYGVIDPLKALGAPAPTETSNPLGGPSSATSPSAVASDTGSVPAASSSTKSSGVGLYAGLGVGVLVLIGLIVFLITRGKNNNGSGGPGGGGGGGNGTFPPNPGPGGWSAQQPYPQPQQPQQYPSTPSPYGQPSQAPQGQPGWPPQSRP